MEKGNTCQFLIYYYCPFQSNYCRYFQEWTINKNSLITPKMITKLFISFNYSRFRYNTFFCKFEITYCFLPVYRKFKLQTVASNVCQIFSRTHKNILKIIIRIIIQIDKNLISISIIELSIFILLCKSYILFPCYFVLKMALGNSYIL